MPIAAFHPELGFLKNPTIINIAGGTSSDKQLLESESKKVSTNIEGVLEIGSNTSPTPSKKVTEPETRDNSTYEEVTLEYDPNTQFIVQSREGPYVMDKSRWPTLIIHEEEGNNEVLTQEESIAAKGGVLLQSKIMQTRSLKWRKTSWTPSLMAVSILI